MGPFATSVFFGRLVEQTKAYKDQDHIDTVILNHATLPDRTESIKNKDKQRLIQLIKQDLTLLEQARVTNIAIPCNTTHFFYDDIQAATDIHVIHMVQSTVQRVRERVGENRQVAVLATDGTVQSKVYEKEIRQTGMRQYLLPSKVQQKVMDIIYHVKENSYFKTKELDDIIAQLVQAGCKRVIFSLYRVVNITVRT